MSRFIKNLHFTESVAIIVGTTLGVGIFGLPFVVAKAGFYTGLIVLTVVGLAMLCSNLFLGEIILSTKENHQITGYAEKYLGRTGKYFMFFTLIFGLYGAMLSYIIASGQILAALFGGSPFLYSMVFFLLCAFLIYHGLSVIKKLELMLTFLMVGVIVVITMLSFHAIHFNNLQGFSWSNIFIPYGAIFFSFGSASALPAMRRVLTNSEKSLKPAVVTGMAIPWIFYIIFIAIVLGVNGLGTTEVATIGLGKAIGPLMVIVANIFAAFTLTTSFLSLGEALKETYMFDFKIRKFTSWFLSISIPLVIYLFGETDFIRVIGLVGAIGGGVQGLVTLVIYLKMKLTRKTERKPEYAFKKFWVPLLFTAMVFLGAVVYTILYL